MAFSAFSFLVETIGLSDLESTTGLILTEGCFIVGGLSLFIELTLPVFAGFVDFFGAKSSFSSLVFFLAARTFRVRL